jgi:hypothetical protein
MSQQLEQSCVVQVAVIQSHKNENCILWVKSDEL